MTNIKNLTRYVLGSGLVLSSLVLAGSPLIASAETLTRQLDLGMSGSDVSSLQTYLATDASIYPQGLVTGYFGSLTASAVSKFQARNGLAQVGRVGPMTLSLLNQKMGNTTVSYGVPAINSVAVSTTNTSATINWNTSQNTSAVVYYGTSPLSMSEASSGSGVTIGGSSFLAHTDLRSSHSATLTGLNPNTTYYYVVYTRDGAGNENITWPTTFVTNQ